jgi:hypothetical protein
MATKRTILERLRSLLRGESAAIRDTDEDAGVSSPTEVPLGLEWTTYEANKRELLRFEGQWVVIHGAEILGIRASYEDALRLGYERAGYVDFLTHQILKNEPVYLLPPQVV